MSPLESHRGSANLWLLQNFKALLFATLGDAAICHLLPELVSAGADVFRVALHEDRDLEHLPKVCNIL